MRKPTSPSNAATPAVFLDRDGVINEDLGYVHRIEDFHFLPGVLDVCRRIVHLGYRLVVVTNQAGIARGYYTTAAVDMLHSWMAAQFSNAGAPISGIYFCPHHPNGIIERYRTTCACRKPAPGMILRAQKDLGIDLSRSILVGDKPSDVAAGRAAGITHCFLLHVHDSHAAPTGSINKLQEVVALLPEFCGHHME